MRSAIGLNPFSGAEDHLAAKLQETVLLVDLSWWLLETVLLVGLGWRAVRRRPVSARIWLAVVWILASAARFTPVLALAYR
ncbi:hypothetical protein BL253_36695 [Pseudofrankia asymbiotica]|uniref:Uncharacterized protein n=1 Tax=Pseudofrankia asymbiotica TaxID=1834516 RepID=A0A1V2I1F4_9ACTN|nr:hypothetical protein BL253_36695 [Pseudofrankia asymbiotica]